MPRLPSYAPVLGEKKRIRPNNKEKLLRILQLYDINHMVFAFRGPGTDTKHLFIRDRRKSTIRPLRPCEDIPHPWPIEAEDYMFYR